MEIGELRRRLDDFVADDETVQLEDEAWWDNLWELLDPALQARADAKRAARSRAVRGDGALWTHRFEFEGATPQLADHLVREHGVPASFVADHERGLTQGDWVALDNLHRAAHEREDATAETATPTPQHRDWGVAWFGHGAESGVCERCQRTTRVYQGYNGGAHMGKFCADCRIPVLRNEA